MLHDETDESTEFSEEIAKNREIMFEWFRNALHHLNAYQLHQGPDAAALRMSFKALALAMGFNDIARANSVSELANNCGSDKQTVNKAVNHFLEVLKLSPLPTQRGREARSNMSRARKAQLA